MKCSFIFRLLSANKYDKEIKKKRRKTTTEYLKYIYRNYSFDCCCLLIF